MKTFLVIFGVSGDLAKRKLLPALTRLKAAGRLSEDVMIIGTARRELNRDALLSEAQSQVLDGQFRLERLDSGDADDLRRLSNSINELSKGEPVAKLIYASVPPSVTGQIMRAVGESGLAAPAGGPVRLLIEKPFGFDLTSARELDAELRSVFAEEHIFRIDHYLNKETARNLGAVRFNNPIFKELWDSRTIDRIEIEALEQLAIENRGDFYDATGALRDIIQSHLLNLAAEVMMDQPAGDSAEATQAARLALLSAVVAPAPNKIATVAKRGQYDGYRTETSNADSITETYAEVNLEVKNDRWQGVPLVLRTGKALSQKLTQIKIYFKGTTTTCGDPNELIFRVQPQEAILLTMEVKAPGLSETAERAKMEYRYPEVSYGDGGAPDGYERVLLDALNGDRRGFISGPEVLEAWRIVEPVLHSWERNGEGLISYPKGAEGI